MAREKAKGYRAMLDFSGMRKFWDVLLEENGYVLDSYLLVCIYPSFLVNLIIAKIVD